MATSKKQSKSKTNPAPQDKLVRTKSRKSRKSRKDDVTTNITLPRELRDLLWDVSTRCAANNPDGGRRSVSHVICRLIENHREELERIANAGRDSKT